MTTPTERAIAAREKKSREAWYDRFPDWTPSERPEPVETPKAKAKPAAKKS
jgi:hypothetical protein